MVTISPDALTGVVELACRAPSVHNSQPWRLIAADGELRLFFDSHRVPRATDHSGRESVISCGALLDHLRVAAAAAGWHADIARFPNPNDLDHLATIEFHRREFVTEADRARAAAIPTRRTDRLPFAAPADWPVFEPVLRSTLDPEKAALYVLDDSDRSQLIQASKLTGALRRHDSSYQAELLWWTAPFEVADGVPYGTLATAGERERVDIAREFPTGEHPDREPRIRHDHSVILVLSTDDDTRREALDCGEALSDVLLEATLAGLATCTLTHVTELKASRGIIKALTGGTREPQLLIRIGEVPVRAEQPAPTPRRRISEVLQFTTGGTSDPCGGGPGDGALGQATVWGNAG